jgi:hypothetical protein
MDIAHLATKPGLFEEGLTVLSVVETHQRTALQTNIILLRHIDLNAPVQATIKTPTHDFAPCLLALCDLVYYFVKSAYTSVHRQSSVRALLPKAK